jgi:hypothetical protein
VAMQLEGIAGAPPAHPRVQKTLPAPFARPSITVGGPQVKRRWQQRPVQDVTEGDIIAGFGQVKLIQEHIEIPADAAVCGIEWSITVTNLLGASKTYPGHETVMVFAAP